MNKNLLWLVIGSFGCAFGNTSVSTAWAGDAVLINGAGATFPYPLYSKWFSDYRKVDPSVQINYQSIGSGGGIRQLLDQTVDFGATDTAMNDEQTAKAKAPIFHLPMVLGAVVVTYNLPTVTKPLRLNGDLIADLFMGKIQKWNDPKLAALNPGVALPDVFVTIAHRSDGSGTTAIFSDYLSKVSPAWKEKIGSGAALQWPVGLGGKGNEGVTGILKQTPGSVGYVEFVYAESNHLQVADLENAKHKVVAPTIASLTAAADSMLKQMPDDFKISVTASPGEGAYPIAGMTYILVYQKTPGFKGKKLQEFLNWAMDEGQKQAPALHYAPLPKSLVLKVKKRIQEIQIGG